MSQCRWAVRLRGRGLRGSQLTEDCLVLDGPLREAAIRERLPADLPQLRAGRRVLFVQHRTSVVPDLVTIADPQPWRTRRRDNVLAIRTPGEMRGVWCLKFGHLRGQTGLENCC